MGYRSPFDDIHGAHGMICQWRKQCKLMDGVNIDFACDLNCLVEQAFCVFIADGDQEACQADKCAELILCRCFDAPHGPRLSRSCTQNLWVQRAVQCKAREDFCLLRIYRIRSYTQKQTRLLEDDSAVETWQSHKSCDRQRGTRSHFSCVEMS